MQDHARIFDTTPEDLSDLSYPHIEALGHRGSRIVYHTPDLVTAKDPTSGLTMFKVDSVFGNATSVLLGCGAPNVALTVHDDLAGAWKKMNAFMLFREKSFVSSVTELQAGVYFELRGLPDHARAALLTQMETHSDKLCPSCAHLNSDILTQAGFTLGNGHTLNRVVRPSKLASLIWRHGLLYQDEAVDMRVVNTSKLEVGDHFVGVWWKEVNSPVRLVRKMVLRKRGHGGSVELPAQQTALRAAASWGGPPVTVWMNRPTALGTYLSFLWGRHAEYRVVIPGFGPIPELGDFLEPFPGKLNRVTQLKKHLLFSRPVIFTINKIKNKSFDRYDNVPLNATLEMLNPVDEARASEEPVLWNFAFVQKPTGYEIRLSPLKNHDPLSRNSKMRRVINWLLAKHVVATGYDPATVYAGEAWVYRPDGQQHLVLCLNNNSGTYRPSADQLETVAVLVRSLGIAVRTFPRDAQSEWRPD